MDIFWYLIVAVTFGWLLVIYINSQSNNPSSGRKPTETGPPRVFIDTSTTFGSLVARSVRSKVVGVSYKNRDGTSRQQIIATDCRPGQTLLLEREPDNPKDANAVGVWAGANQIGYIASGRLAADLSHRLLIGAKVTAEISNITGGTTDKPTRGVNIEIHIWQ